MRDVQMLVLGGCSVRFPAFRATGQWTGGAETNRNDPSVGAKIVGSYFTTYTFGEMLQAISCYRGDRQIPSELHALCRMKTVGAPTPANSPLGKADVTLAEPTTSVEIEFEGYHVNRVPVMHLLDSLASIDPSVKKLCGAWYSKGIAAMDDEMKCVVAEQLIPLIPEDSPHRELTAAVLMNATGGRRDVRDGMKRLAESLDMPLGVVAYTFRYMPDGRPISWPAAFYGEILSAAHELKLPVFEPREYVEQAGVAIALKADLRHYTEAFLKVLGKPMIKFALSVASGDAFAAAEPTPGSMRTSAAA